MSIFKWVLVAIPITIGWFFLLEMIAPGHWGFFQTYFSATWSALWNQVGSWVS